MSSTSIYETVGAPPRGFCVSDDDLGQALRALASLVDDNPQLCLNAIAVTNDLEEDLNLVWTLYAVFDDMADEEQEPISPFLELVTRHGATTGS
jgi:hypothetical protein